MDGFVNGRPQAFTDSWNDGGYISVILSVFVILFTSPSIGIYRHHCRLLRRMFPFDSKLLQWLWQGYCKEHTILGGKITTPQPIIECSSFLLMSTSMQSFRGAIWFNGTWSKHILWNWASSGNVLCFKAPHATCLKGLFAERQEFPFTGKKPPDQRYPLKLLFMASRWNDSGFRIDKLIVIWIKAIFYNIINRSWVYF